MDGTELKKVFNFTIYPEDSKITTIKRIVNIDKGNMGGTHWTFLYLKDNQSFYFASFAGFPDKFLLEHLTKPKNLHNY